MCTTRPSRAIFGGHLWGDLLVRYIFMDEAGTSALEPVTIIVGLIANADDHVMSAEALAHEAIGAVPAQYKKDFVFHAMQVFGGSKYQSGNWGLTDRLDLLQTMMSIPRRIGMAVTLSVMWRGAVDYLHGEGIHPSLSPSESDHLMAFHQCVAIADRAIRKHAGPREVATIVAEDVPKMRRFMKVIPRILRENPDVVPQEYLRQTITDLEAGHNTQLGDLRVTRIRNSVHFVEKADDPLVQVADACAYGFRRYFAKEKFGLEFVRAIVGNEEVLRNFASPGGCEYYWPRSPA